MNPRSGPDPGPGTERVHQRKVADTTEGRAVMAWGTGKGGGGGDGKHAGKKDPGTSAPSPDTAQPKQPPKHGK